MPSSKPPKKSEMLEVRLSFEDKQKLQQKAQNEGQSVSHVIRKLIAEYLESSKTRTFTQKIMDDFMSTQIKLKSSLAAGTAIIAGLLFLSPLSHADEIGLKFQGSVIQQQEDEIRTRTFETEVLVDEGEIMSFEIGDTSSAQLQITFSIKEVKEGYFIDLKIADKKNGEMITIAEPKLIFNKDGKATINVGIENEEEYTLIITPSDISESQL